MLPSTETALRIIDAGDAHTINDRRMRAPLSSIQSLIISKAEALRGHPEFTAARNLYARHYVAALKDSKTLVNMSTGEVRQVVGAYVLDRHFSYTAGDLSSGVTVSDVQSFCTGHALAGFNRIGSLLNLLRDEGYLRQHKEARDRRVKRLEVTEQAIAASKRFVTPLFLALSQLEQLDSAVAKFEADDRLLAGIAQCWSRYCLAHGSLVNLVPDMRLFMSRSAGYEVLLKLVSADRPGEVMADSTVHFHYGAAADYFGVSRVHVRRLLEDAEVMGYLSLHAPGGRAVQVHSSLSDLTDNYVSLQLALLFEGVHNALAQG